MRGSRPSTSLTSCRARAGSLLGEGACGPRLQREPARPVVAQAGLVEQRSREGPRVAASRGGALEAEDRAATIRVDGEHLLVGARGAGRIAEQLLPEERHLLEVRRLAARILRLFDGLRVELHERARARAGLRHGDGGRQEPGERVEDLGVPRGGDPCRAQVPNRVRGPPDLDADLSGPPERTGTPGGVLGPRGLLQPRGDALLGLARSRQQAVERFDERGVGGVDREGALHVRDGGIEIAVVLGGCRERAKLVGDRSRIGDEAQPRTTRARGVDPARVELVEPHELVERPAVDARCGRRPCRRALEERARSAPVLETPGGDRGGLELEPSGAGTVRLDHRLLVEKAHERSPVALRGRMSHESVAHRADPGVELHGALERVARRVDALEAPLEDLRSLDVQPGSERRLALVRLCHAHEVRRERLPLAARRAGGHGARDELGLEALERAGVVGGHREGDLPGGHRVGRAIAERLQQPRLDHE